MHVKTGCTAVVIYVVMPLIETSDERLYSSTYSMVGQTKRVYETVTRTPSGLPVTRRVGIQTVYGLLVLTSSA